uniref:Guanine nucleotide-binding protein subunit gamma n=2 Tax=Anolis carolinensis TaxID=28377 RepID=A0A803TT64_ANOCA
MLSLLVFSQCFPCHIPSLLYCFVSTSEHAQKARHFLRKPISSGTRSTLHVSIVEKVETHILSLKAFLHPAIPSPLAHPTLPSWTLGTLHWIALTYNTATMPAINIEDLSEKEKLKMEVEQLRKEVKLDRQPVSKCSEEIKNYIEERSGDDPLVKGIPEDRNPFKEKGGCIIA